MATSTGQMTVEQYLALPEQCDANGNDVISELIAGEIVLAPLPSAQHDRAKNRICKVLTLFLDSRPELALEANVQFGYAVTEIDALIPDVSVMATGRLQEVASRVLTGAPRIAIEVISPSDTAVNVRHKIETYLQNGSSSVWIVYPESRSVEVRTKAGIRQFISEQPIEDEVLPGFSHPVSDFF